MALHQARFLLHRSQTALQKGRTARQDQVQGDLKELSKKLSQTSDFKVAIIESEDSDYAYRMVVPRSILATFMVGLIINLDYKNFKAMIPILRETPNGIRIAYWREYGLLL